MKSIAVIGAGVSGLAAASFLSRRHRVHLFEKEDRLGGHTNTVVIATPRGGVPLDTGFLVKPSHLVLLREIVRFNREAPALLDAPDTDRQTLGDFLERHAGLFQMLLVKNGAQRALFNEPWSEVPGTPRADAARESAA